jgi:hypothetical protein
MSMSLILRNSPRCARKLAVTLTLVVVALAAFAATSATAASASITDAVNPDNQGYSDAAIREKGQAPTFAPFLPWLHTYDVGAKCYASNIYPDSVAYTLTIRPPAVWPLSSTGLTSQKVAWQAVFVRSDTNTVVKYGGWQFDTAPTQFGGLDTTNIYNDDYYTGSESYTGLEKNDGTSFQVYPWVEVAWQTNGVWGNYSYMRVNWVKEGTGVNYYGMC